MNAPQTPATAIDTAVDTGELPRRVVIATMAGVIATMLMASLDGTIVGTAMPKIIGELHGFEHYAAVTTIYMLASTTVVPIAGKLSDLFGRKPFLLMGVVLFVIGSALCGAATSMTQLVIFRGIQGLGAGCTQAMAFTTIADLFPPSRRGRVTGMMGAVFGLSSVIGPAVGGFLTDGPGWRWCFYVNLPVGAVAFAILFFAFPPRAPSTKKPEIDFLGAFALVASVVPVLLALSWGGRDYAWDSPLIVALLAGGIGMGVAFVFIERRQREPIIPPSLFLNRVVATSAVGAMLTSVAMFGSLMFIPLFIQAVIGASATRSGAVLTPMMFAMIASSVTTGQLITRTGRYKVFALLGVSLTATGMALLSQMDIATTYNTVLRNMVVMGVGLGLTLPVFNLAVQNAVDVRQVGVATSSVQFLRSMGGAIGAAVFGAVLSARFAPAFHAALPADVAQRVPPEVLARFDNPQALMGGGDTAPVAPAMADLMTPVMTAVKTGLASSLGEVFLLGAILVGIAFVVTLFNRDLKLRTSNRVPAPAGE